MGQFGALAPWAPPFLVLPMDCQQFCQLLAPPLTDCFLRATAACLRHSVLTPQGLLGAWRITFPDGCESQLGCVKTIKPCGNVSEGRQNETRGIPKFGSTRHVPLLEVVFFCASMLTAMILISTCCYDTSYPIAG